MVGSPAGQYRGRDPWSEKVPAAMGQLSLCTTATEARALEPTLRTTRKQPLLSAARERPRVATRTQHSKNK